MKEESQYFKPKGENTFRIRLSVENAAILIPKERDRVPILERIEKEECWKI